MASNCQIRDLSRPITETAALNEISSYLYGVVLTDFSESSLSLVSNFCINGGMCYQ